ncbi:MAG: VOC family protein [Ilumatobacteraceae bacterium]
MADRLDIFQYAYFVEDLDAAAAEWAELNGAGPFFVAPHHTADRFTYRGTDVEADVSYAFGYSGDAQIQLIQQHDGLPSIYRDMYEPGRFGFHHVAKLVADYEGERQRLLDAGCTLACELYANDIVACYFDTRDRLGHFTELHSRTDRIVSTFDRWRQAHADWDGSGDTLRHHVSGT